MVGNAYFLLACTLQGSFGVVILLNGFEVLVSFPGLVVGVSEVT